MSTRRPSRDARQGLRAQRKRQRFGRQRLGGLAILIQTHRREAEQIALLSKPFAWPSLKENSRRLGTRSQEIADSVVVLRFD